MQGYVLELDDGSGGEFRVSNISRRSATPLGVYSEVWRTRVDLLIVECFYGMGQC